MTFMTLSFKLSNKRYKLWTEFIRIFNISFRLAEQHYTDISYLCSLKEKLFNNFDEIILEIVQYVTVIVSMETKCCNN